jgi:hypothetical protein
MVPSRLARGGQVALGARRSSIPISLDLRGRLRGVACSRRAEEGDEVELNEQDGKRLVEAGVLEEANKSKRRAQVIQVWGCGALAFSRGIPPARRTLQPRRQRHRHE